jgi:peptidoglycan/xylan/chitin deacetylase (PgdA/CDA1 family)
MNQRLKRAIERAAVVSGLPRLGNILNKNRCVVLMYHNIVPSGVEAVGDLSLHLTQPDFAEHLDLFERHFDVVPLIDLLDDHASTVERPRIAITFDDAYVGALTVGVQELVGRRMPATIFVPPGLLGREAWWDVVASRTSGEIPAGERRDLLVALGGRSEAILASVPASFGTAPRPASQRIATQSELAAAAGSAGISIGSHTWTHPNLAALVPSELQAELTRPLQWLRDRFPSFIPVVSYPYGLSSDSVEAAASEAGYRAGLRADGGWLTPEKLARPFALPRFNVPANLSLDGLWARLGIGVVR